MKELMNKETITSLELVDQINIFRKQEGKKTELQHKDLLKVIRDEFEEEIGEGKISPTYYKDQWNREQPMFILTLNQAKQVLVRESKYVRKAVIHYIEDLETKLKIISVKPMTENQKKNVEIRERDSRIREAEFLKSLIQFSKSDTYKEILVAESARIATGREILPLPKLEENTYTAQEVGELLGISSNKVGRIANTYKLKNRENGIIVHDKAKYCNKEVEGFRYNKRGIEEIKKYI